MISRTLRRHTGLKTSAEEDSSVTGDIIQIIEDEDGPDGPDLNISHSFKRSGTHNLDRIGYHEESEYMVKIPLYYRRNLQLSRMSQRACKILRTHPKELPIQRRNSTGSYPISSNTCIPSNTFYLDLLNFTRASW